MLVVVFLGAVGITAGCSRPEPTENVSIAAEEPAPETVDEPAKFVATEPAEPIQPLEPMAETLLAETDAKDAPPASEAPAAADAPSAAEAPIIVQTLHLAPDEPAKVPPVLLTNEHEALCQVKVGDTLPELELPRLEGGQAKLADLYGKSATVVVFWKSNRRMARDELADLGPDVVAPYGSRGVAVVGIAVQETAANARIVLDKAEADFPNLLDADVTAFAQVGAKKLPWTLLLDADGKIVWFDIEYSHATRRELQQALLAIVR